MNLIFDLDGTLIDSRPGIIESIRYATLSILKVDINIDKIRIGPPINIMIKELFPDISEHNMERMLTNFRHHYDTKGWKNFSVYPKVIKTLTELNEKNHLFIATNKPEKPTLKILNKMNILCLFEKVFCFSSKRYSNKSDMLSAIKSNSIYNYLMIGDSKDDFVAAFNNNIEFIYCSYGYGFIDKSKINVKQEIEKFEDLIKFKGDY